ncbi:LUD domain-containing protein [Streptomyces sp. N2-109]|uniref:LUD domain-containing protein n=1 Tax=Streptomyces gossypii TaxID=2883101 RepID=A0ABT2JN10_9ACTN|nr:LUD domain-containing protein [Streptomyces gossypii]MCT2589267.1 LUD domain-containing protein [Streptomyces gossypii]
MPANVPENASGQALRKAPAGAREEILARVRRALADVPAAEEPADVAVARDYARAGGPAPGSPAVRELLVERLIDYDAAVRTVTAADAASVAEAVARSAAARTAGPLVVPDGFPAEWLAALPPERVLRDEPPLGVGALDRAGAVLTTAAAAVATTGTLVLDCGPGQGRRALTLVPDHHLCVVRAGQVVASVPEVLAGLEPARPLTFISGPSATSDIELDRIEGVHGPRTLEVLVLVEG